MKNFSNLLENPSSFFSTNKKILSFAALLIVLAVVFSFQYFSSSSSSNYNVLIYSSQAGQSIPSAQVELITSNGKVIANQTVTNGLASFPLNLIQANQNLTLQVNAQGFSQSNSILETNSSVSSIYLTPEATKTDNLFFQLTNQLGAQLTQSYLIVNNENSSQVINSTNGSFSLISPNSTWLSLTFGASGFDSKHLSFFVQTNSNYSIVLFSSNANSFISQNSGISDQLSLTDSSSNTSSNLNLNVSLLFVSSTGLPINGTLTLTNPMFGTLVGSYLILNGWSNLTNFNTNYLMQVNSTFISGTVYGYVNSTDLLFSFPLNFGNVQIPQYDSEQIILNFPNGQNSNVILNVYDQFTGALLNTQLSNSTFTLANIAEGQSITLVLFSPYYLPLMYSEIFGTAQTLNLNLVSASGIPSRFSILNSTLSSDFDLSVYPQNSVFNVPILELNSNNILPINAYLPNNENYSLSVNFGNSSIFSTPVFQTPSNVVFWIDNNSLINYCFYGNVTSCNVQPSLKSNNFALTVNLQSENQINSMPVSIGQNNTIIQSSTLSSTNPVEFSNLASGNYTIFYSYEDFFESENISLTQNTQLNISIPIQNTTLVVQAINQTNTINPLFFSSVLSYANQTISCSSVVCSFTFPQNTNYSLSVQSVGFSGASLSGISNTNPISYKQVVLFPQNNQMNYLGVFDGYGNRATGLFSNNTYSLKFSLPISASSVSSLYLSITSNEQNQAPNIDFAQSNFADTPNYFLVSYSSDFQNSSYCNQNQQTNWAVFQLINNQTTPTNELISIPISVINSENQSNTFSYQYSSENSSFSFNQLESGLYQSNCQANGSTQITLNTQNQADYCNFQGVLVPNGCLSNSIPLMCQNGAVFSNPSQCGCVSGQILSDNSCIDQYCSDGTLAYTCSKINQPLFCQPNSSGQLSLVSNSSISCTCPQGQTNSNGVCEPCTNSSCSSTCNYNGVNVPEGCIDYQSPLFCSPSNGQITSNPQICGCPNSEFYNPQTNQCIPSVTSYCDNLQNQANFGQFCSSLIPYQCVLTSSGYQLQENYDLCGCSGNNQLVNGVCQPITNHFNENQTSNANSTFNSIQVSSNVSINVVCSVANQCISKGTNDLFCNSNNSLQSFCQYCNPSCNSNQYLYCNPSDNSCEQKTCSDGTQLDSCSSNYLGYRCQLSNGISASLEQNFTLCPPCSSNEQWNSSTNTCSSCTDSSCQTNPSSVCTFQQDGSNYSFGSCLSNNYGSSGTVLRCENNGQIVPDTVCGCKSGYSLNSDGSSCITNSNSYVSTQTTDNCPLCTNNVSVEFNPATNSLNVLNSNNSINFQIDSIYPADSINLSLISPSTASNFYTYNFQSTDGSSNCLSYNAQTGELTFSLAQNNCPLIVAGNSIYLKNAGSSQPVTSASSQMVIATSSFPSATLILNITVTILQEQSIYLTPNTVTGASTNQLVYLINQLQPMFGSRQISVNSNPLPIPSLQNGVQTLSINNAGTYSFSDQSYAPIGQIAYQKAASYFQTNDPLSIRIDSPSTCENNFDCCASGWCSVPALNAQIQAFKQYAKNLASTTAFRRGNSLPFSQISPVSSFQVYSVVQVAAGGITDLENQGFNVNLPSQCQSSNPAIFQLTAQTQDNVNWNYGANVLTINSADYLAGSCNVVNSNSPQNPYLCNYLSSTNTCLLSSGSSSITSNIETSNPLPYVIDSPFLGAPPTFFLSPLALIPILSSFHSKSSSSYTFSNMLENLLLFYQPRLCENILAPLYSLKQHLTNSACLMPYWAFKLPILGASLGYAITNSMSIQKTLRTCEDAGGVGGISSCLTSLNSAVTAETTSANSQLNAIYGPGGANCDTICGFADPLCVSTCQLDYSTAQETMNSAIQRCNLDANAEITAGVSCEKAKGELMDLPLVYPIKRTAWSTCYAYSNGCQVACQPKQAYLQIIEIGNQLFYFSHYGLDSHCNPIAPLIYSAFSSASANQLYSRLSTFQSSPISESSIFSNNYVSNAITLFSTIYSSILISSTNLNCPIPPKPPASQMFSINTCEYTPLETNAKLSSTTNPIPFASITPSDSVSNVYG